MKVLLIDFYDSFTYNIFHYLESCGADVSVIEDRAIKIDEVELYDAIIFSPGPGLPKDTCSMMPVLERYSHSKKILGICLGMQGIAVFYGEKLYNLKHVKHGVSEQITIDNSSRIFTNLTENQTVGLYHSWAVELKENSQLEALGKSNENVLMALKNKHLPLYGVQFHPESILTHNGKEMLRNFLFVC
ncbi:MAG: aminodeoxychorismate/anthranilate synthase component II [Crocinitomicaceae bacterium]|nr:aminodeoxychorismate/anthranilate synthase component II [Crocinitomicaceae bacterium]